MSLSASVTRILTLSGFPPELKTRDIQQAFGEWESERGGFKIKWVDDTTLMLVFVDAGTAKRAYLHTILNPPAQLLSQADDKMTVIKPYDGPDAQVIIQNVNNRANSKGHGSRQSMSIDPTNGNALAAHRRGQSYAGVSGGSLGRAGGLNIAAANGLGMGNLGREPSPTLPSLPTHPTLNALISSSLSDMSGVVDDKESHGGGGGGLSGGVSVGPKVGDPGRRMVGHALGIRHPSVAMRSNEKEAMAVVAE